MSRRWREGETVHLSVSDTAEPKNFGRTATGIVEHTYQWKAAPGRDSIAAFIRLHNPLLEDVSQLVVYLRARHSFIWGSDTVYVVPWSSAVPPSDDDINDAEMKHRVVCLAEMKVMR